MLAHKKMWSRIARLMAIMAAVMMVLVSCIAPAAPQAPAGPATEQEQVELVVHVGNYTPGVVRGEGLEPLTKFTEIAEAYTQLHPNVKITNYVAPEVANYLEWALPLLSGGTAPDIMIMKNEWAYQYKDNNWFVDLMPYLEQPNPYVDGNTKWWDLFFENTTRAKIQANGALYGLPIDLVATGIVYNKAIFAEAGVEPPTTWAEFVAIQEKLKAAGYVPFVAQSPINHVDWSFVALFEGTALDVIRNLDSLDPNGFTNHEELCRGAQKGWLNFNDPQQQEWLRLFAEWSQYLQGDWTADKDHLNLWLTGKGAMAWVGTWQVVPILADPLRDFEFGTFWLPPITTETSEFGTGTFIRGIGGAHSTQLAITNTAIEGGKMEVALDFLQFLSAPERAIPMIEEANTNIPNIKGERSSDLLDGMMSSITSEAGPGEQFVFLGFYDSQAGDLGRRTVQQVTGGSLSVEEGAAELQRLLEDACQRLITDNPQWDQSKW